jgi:hypothetical protein
MYIAYKTKFTYKGILGDHAGLPDGLFVKTKIPIRVKFGGPWDWKG